MSKPTDWLLGGPEDELPSPDGVVAFVAFAIVAVAITAGILGASSRVTGLSLMATIPVSAVIGFFGLGFVKYRRYREEWRP